MFFSFVNILPLLKWLKIVTTYGKNFVIIKVHFCGVLLLTSVFATSSHSFNTTRRWFCRSRLVPGLVVERHLNYSLLGFFTAIWSGLKTFFENPLWKCREKDISPSLHSLSTCWRMGDSSACFFFFFFFLVENLFCCMMWYWFIYSSEKNGRWNARETSQNFIGGNFGHFCEGKRQ